MKTVVFRDVKLSSLSILLILLVLVFGQFGCNKASDAGASQIQSLRAARIDSSLDRLTNVLQLSPDGTVSLDVNDPDYISLVQGDKAFGKALLASLNTKVREGLIRVNPDFSAEWLGPPSSCSQCVGGSRCTRHWWGESCYVSSSTTKDILIGLESGEGALIICGFIPVVDVACEIIEVVGAIPLEAEIRPCANRGDSSTFHVTWIGAAWFTCN